MTRARSETGTSFQVLNISPALSMALRISASVVQGALAMTSLVAGLVTSIHSLVWLSTNSPARYSGTFFMLMSLFVVVREAGQNHRVAATFNNRLARDRPRGD